MLECIDSLVPDSVVLYDTLNKQLYHFNPLKSESGRHCRGRQSYRRDQSTLNKTSLYSAKGHLIAFQQTTEHLRTFKLPTKLRRREVL